MLCEPGSPYRRGRGELLGHVMRALGDRPARTITTREIDSLLRTVVATGVSARAVNKTRNIVDAAFNYAMRESTFALSANPALDADVRREAHRGVLYYYSPGEIEQIADGVAAGVRREPGRERDAQQIALTDRTASSSGLPPTSGCGSVRSSRCAGAMSTCAVRSSRSRAR